MLGLCCFGHSGFGGLASGGCWFHAGLDLKSVSGGFRGLKVAAFVEFLVELRVKFLSGFKVRVPGFSVELF